MSPLLVPIARLRAQIPRMWRLPLLSLGIGLVAVVGALVLSTIGGAAWTNLDWSLYDLWAKTQRATLSENIVVVEGPSTSTEKPPVTSASRPSQHTARSLAADDSHWDRTNLARTIAALAQADATAIGLLDELTVPATPEQGGAVSDALLAEAMVGSNRVVIPTPLVLTSSWSTGGTSTASLEPHTSWLRSDVAVGKSWLSALPTVPLLASAQQSAASVGTVLAHPDRDGDWRRLPLGVTVSTTKGPHLIPAYGVALYLTHREQSQSGSTAGTTSRQDSKSDADLLTSTDRQGRLLVPTLRAPLTGSTVLPLAELLNAVADNNHEQLRSWVAGRIVILPSTRSREQSGEFSTSSILDMPAHTTDLTRQLALLNHLLSPRTRLSIAPMSLAILLAWMVAAATAWSLVRTGRLPAVVTVGALLIALGLITSLCLAFAHVVIPIALPLTTMIFASVGAIGWRQVMVEARKAELEDQVRRVQDDLVALRDAVHYQESTVERLEEDLEAARARESTVSRREEALHEASADVRRQLEDARQAEADTRAQLAGLERDLAALRSATVDRAALPERELESLREEAARLGIITRDRGLLQLVRDVRRAAPSSLAVLIVGESGTGKELFARAVHRLSPRQAQPFIAVNMAAVTHELFESELFGHVRGSFSGATQDRRGFFELADRGTLFLDEIGDLRADHQAKLLRVLQDKTFYRVGASKPTQVDVRIVAATNRDLVRGIAEGWFREDLYARLKGVLISLPPLRERRDDIPVLVDQMVRRAAAQHRRAVPEVTREAMDALCAAPWPHNVRELEQCIEQAVALSSSDRLGLHDFRLSDGTATASNHTTADGPAAQRPGATTIAGGASQPDIHGDQAVLECLRAQAFDMQKTARALGWERSTVTQRLKGLCFHALVETQGDRSRAAQMLAGDLALVRVVELKLAEYADHLFSVVDGFATAQEATLACRKRFKNLPERHFKAVERLIQQRFTPDRSTSSLSQR
ncbi:MAG: sigma 54-interacting transcriptional regulator [Nitrospiraceae bacterium]